MCMNYFTYQKRLDYLLELIQNGQVQSPNDLTYKFDCTERTIRNMINHLRDMGYDIKYCRKNFRYVLNT